MEDRLRFEPVHLQGEASALAATFEAYGIPFLVAYHIPGQELPCIHHTDDVDRASTAKALEAVFGGKDG